MRNFFSILLLILSGGLIALCWYAAIVYLTKFPTEIVAAIAVYNLIAAVLLFWSRRLDRRRRFERLYERTRGSVEEVVRLTQVCCQFWSVHLYRNNSLIADGILTASWTQAKLNLCNSLNSSLEICERTFEMMRRARGIPPEQRTMLVETARLMEEQYEVCKACVENPNTFFCALVNPQHTERINDYGNIQSSEGNIKEESSSRRTRRNGMSSIFECAERFID